MFKIPAPDELLKDYPNSPSSLDIDWRSAKHHLLVLYYCFNLTHMRIEAAREWASSRPANLSVREHYLKNSKETKKQFDYDAIRLNAWMTLAMRDIEIIRVKFRPSVWYCHVPIVREIVDFYSKKCTPIHTAQNTSLS